MYKIGDIIQNTVNRKLFLIELLDPDEGVYYVLGLNYDKYRGPITTRFVDNYCAWVA